MSRIPTLGYGVTYAVGNVLLALWGSVIVRSCGEPEGSAMEGRAETWS